MTDYKMLLETEPYRFLKENPYLANSTILLGISGSIGYGMNNENSDVDLRGIAVNSRRYILTGRDFEQVTDSTTDTTIYSFDKIIRLLCACNPNTIELLGLRPEHYLKLTEAGRLLVENSRLFLSKRAIYSFGGYANSQLRRLENKSNLTVDRTKQESHLLKSIEHAAEDIKRRYADYGCGQVRFYMDETDRPDFEQEVYTDISLNHYPLRDLHGLLSETGEIVKTHNKLGKRNENAISGDKLGKHSAHLLRLYFMCFDILEKGEIITYREKEHDLLMDVRNGKYLDENGTPIREFFEIVDALDEKLDRLKMTTELPDNVDMEKVMDLVEHINEAVVYGKEV